LSLVFQQNAAAKIVSSVCKLPVFKTSKFIATYFAFNNEVDSLQLIKNIWQEQKNCYLPVVQNNQMLFIQYEESDQLIKNRFGIFEPLFDIKKTISADELDLVIVPVVGFDEKANRLGSGGGYYDQTFAFKKQQKNLKPYLIGIAYELQKLSPLAMRDWDVPMDIVITEKKCYP
jgi:5-formyltetrahydrofolate cyclo-ligase